MKDTAVLQADQLWNPSPELTKRVKKLRDEYENLESRDYFRNEVIPFTTGTDWDAMWSPSQWGVVPELIPFNRAFLETMTLVARKVELPPDFWKKPHVIRVAAFFREVIARYLPVQILEGELIVGGHFNVALSRVHNRKENREWMKLTEKWMKEIESLNSHGLGNAGATPGHLIPDYRRALREGLKGLVAYFERLRSEASDEGHKDFLSALIITCEGAREFAARYAEEARRLAAECEDEGRRAELLEIARICEKVPWEPPETFHEALQALWFIHMLVMVQESYPGPGLSPGRIDQYLYPYYESDIGGGESRRSRRENSSSVSGSSRTTLTTSCIGSAGSGA